MDGRDICQGRVEIYYQGRWGTVCDDDWDAREAEVVCRQLGCGRVVSAHTNSYFGYGTGHILLDNVNCMGGEEQLAQCTNLGWSNHNCGHHEDAGITCSGTLLRTFYVYLKKYVAGVYCTIKANVSHQLIIHLDLFNSFITSQL